MGQCSALTNVWVRMIKMSSTNKILGDIRHFNLCLAPLCSVRSHSLGSLRWNWVTGEYLAPYIAMLGNRDL